MKIKFCGAAREVTGSAHLITLEDGYTILLDCGMYQGRTAALKKFNETWLFEPEKIDCLILSHAHIDHTGRVPKLVKDGFSGSIHCTHATRSLCAIMLLDSARIQERDAEYASKRLQRNGELDEDEMLEPLYTPEHATKAMTLFTSYSYDKWNNIRPGIDVMFRDTGHILGSASVTLRIQEGDRQLYVGFTGDIGRPNRPILRDPQPMPEVDVLICESTYGDREHIEKPAELTRLLEIITDTCVKRRGKLIIPAFSVGRTQELVYLLDQMETQGQLPAIPVYVDSPLAVDATTVFGAHPECYDENLQEYLLTDENAFGFKHLTYIHKVDDSKALNNSHDPCIIISASGMMNAGRIKHHAYNNIADSRNTILLVGYASPDTPAGALRRGATTLRLFGEELPVRAHIEQMDSFSAHGDRLEMLEFISNQRDRAKRVFLVHGEEEAQLAFRQTILDYGFRQVDVPSLGDEVVI